jgi:heme/copper-type cytochrome/quinol oxidase subunit 2
MSMAKVLFGIAAVACAVAEGAILRSVLIQPARPSGEPTAPPSPRAIEILWAVLPAIALGVLLVYSWHAITR